MAKMLFIVVLWICAFAAPAFGEDKFFDSNGVKIRYIDEGTGEAVLLVHGNRGNLDSTWIDSGVLANLKHNYRVIAFDLRGNGKSDKPHHPEAYGVEMTTDAIRLLNHLNITRAHIVGYSFGSGIVAKLLTLAPRSLHHSYVGRWRGRSTLDR